MIVTRILVLCSLLILFFPPGINAFSDKSDSAGINSYEGKTISHIYINNIDVSGPSVYDGRDWQPDFIGEAGNALHFKTRPWVIKDILLFKEGDKFDSQTINESERLLRETGYFYDARISTEDGEGQGTVNISVTTKDKWTLDPRISYSPKNNSGYAGLSDKNFLGIGHSAGISIDHNEDPYIGWGGNLNYSINNIKGSFVVAALNLSSNNKSNLLRLSLSRPFLTTSTKWAGGLEFTWQHDDLSFIKEDNTVTRIFNSYDSQDLWTGRSFPVLFGTDMFKRNSSFVLSARYYRKHFRIRPVVSPDSNQIFENHRLYLASFGILNRYFYKSYYVNEFGVTEDIPLGGMVTLTTGSDAREFNNRWYYGMQMVYSAYLVNMGYFSGKFELGGFRYSGKWEQNAIKLSLIYHSPLFRKQDWKARLFIQNEYVRGLNRFGSEQLYLDRTSGMPGFNESEIAGIKRNVMDIEMRMFTPYNILGFVIGGIAFGDFGLIAGNGENLLNSRIYQAYGLGLRTKNQSISNTSFELAFIYNPYHPLSGTSNTEISFSAAIVLGSRNFNFNKPVIINLSGDE